jgi:hypothetical protein
VPALQAQSPELNSIPRPIKKKKKKKDREKKALPSSGSS